MGLVRHQAGVWKGRGATRVGGRLKEVVRQRAVERRAFRSIPHLEQVFARGREPAFDLEPPLIDLVVDPGGVVLRSADLGWVWQTVDLQLPRLRAEPLQILRADGDDVPPKPRVSHSWLEVRPAHLRRLQGWVGSIAGIGLVEADGPRLVGRVAERPQQQAIADRGVEALPAEPATQAPFVDKLIAVDASAARMWRVQHLLDE